jgi:hypothetical protein
MLGLPRNVCVGVLVCFVLVGVLGAAAPAQAVLPSRRTWLGDVRQAMSGAQTYVERRAARGGRHLAVNLDIDNTALTTHYDRGEPVGPVLRFAERARALGVVQLFNTGRLRGNERLARARRLLTSAGYHVAAICGRRHGEAVAHSKQRCRRHFAHEGYVLVANVGNRRTDFVGGGYERAFRLPSYGGRLG